MVQFLSIIFFSWISSIFVGFFKSSRIFFVSLCIGRAKFSLRTRNWKSLRQNKQVPLRQSKGSKFSVEILSFIISQWAKSSSAEKRHISTAPISFVHILKMIYSNRGVVLKGNSCALIFNTPRQRLIHTEEISMEIITVRDSRNSSVKTWFHAISQVANGYFIIPLSQVTESVL